MVLLRSVIGGGKDWSPFPSRICTAVALLFLVTSQRPVLTSAAEEEGAEIEV